MIKGTGLALVVLEAMEQRIGGMLVILEVVHALEKERRYRKRLQRRVNSHSQVC